MARTDRKKHEGGWVYLKTKKKKRSKPRDKSVYEEKKEEGLEDEIRESTFDG